MSFDEYILLSTSLMKKMYCGNKERKAAFNCCPRSTLLFNCTQDITLVPSLFPRAARSSIVLAFRNVIESIPLEKACKFLVSQISVFPRRKKKIKTIIQPVTIKLWNIRTKITIVLATKGATSDYCGMIKSFFLLFLEGVLM